MSDQLNEAGQVIQEGLSNAANEAAPVVAAVTNGITSTATKIGETDGARQISQTAQQGYNTAAPVVAEGARKVGDAAQQGYNAAAPVVADGARKVGDMAQQGYNTAAPVVTEGARQIGDMAQQGYNTAAPVVADGARKVGDMAQQGYNAAAPVVTEGARQIGDVAQQGYNTAAPIIADGARKVADGAQKVGAQIGEAAAPHVAAGGQIVLKGVNSAYSASKPIVVNLAGQAADQAGNLAGQGRDMLSNVTVPNISFDTAAAQSALYGGVSMGVTAAASAATGCAAFAMDILKLEIFRDFYQFLSIFFSSLDMPEGFKVFFGNVSAVFGMGLIRLLSYFTDVKAALNPNMWYFIMLLLMIICWSWLSCFMDTGKYAGLKMLSKAQKAKKDWKEINKISMTKFKQTKYLLLALTTLYTPVTRNAIQMALCAPKYHYAKYDCLKDTAGADAVKLLSFYGSGIYDLKNPCLNATATDAILKAKAAASLAKCTSIKDKDSFRFDDDADLDISVICSGDEFTGNLIDAKDSTNCAGKKCTTSDASVCCETKTTRDEKLKANTFTEHTTGAHCAANGDVTLTSETECKAAADELLGYGSKSIHSTTSSFYPQGCSYSVTFRRVYWNTRASSTEQCSNDEKCLCKKGLPKSEQVAKTNCVSWRQTGGCNPDGTREPENDKPCWDTISTIASGYCECKNGKKKESTCDHEAFTCNDVCGDRRRLAVSKQCNCTAAPIVPGAKCSTITNTSTPTLNSMCGRKAGDLVVWGGKASTKFTGDLISAKDSTSCEGSTCTSSDAMTCCKYKSSFFSSFTLGNNCEANNEHTIISEKECQKASATKYGRNTILITTSTQKEMYPKGCSYGGTRNSVYWNDNFQSSRSCSGLKACVCKDSYSRRFLKEDDETSTVATTETECKARGQYCALSSSDSIDTSLPDFVALPGYKIVKQIDAAYPICYAGNHSWMTFLSIVVLIAFSLYFPHLMNKVIDYEKPKPLSPKDPENPVCNPPKQRPGPDGVFVPTASYIAKKALYDKLHGKAVIFNDEGKLVEYTDEIFLIEVKKQSDSPFTTMYKGFERRWANYKVIVMKLKLFQLVLTTLATSVVMEPYLNTPALQGTFGAVVCLVSMSIFLTFSCKANPYVDHINDKMEMISKITLIITPTLVFLAIFIQIASIDLVVSWLMNISSFLGNGFMIWLTISAMACCQTKLKQFSGNLAFSSPDGFTPHMDPETIPDWDLDVERKRRIWKPFWDKIMNKNVLLSGEYDLKGAKATDKACKAAAKKKGATNVQRLSAAVAANKLKEMEDRIEQNGGKRFLKEENASQYLFNDTTPIPYPLKRFETELSKLRTRGFDAFESGTLPMPAIEFDMRMKFQSMFEGPDVYCNDKWTTDAGISAVKDGSLTKSNGFCRMEVDPYPYCLNLYWDGSGHDYAEVPSWGEHKFRLQELWNMQCIPDVIRMKHVRLQIRGAANSQALLHNPYRRVENCTRQIKDGVDKDGKQKYKTEHYQIKWDYTNGVVHVRGDYGDSEFEQGMRVTMYYADGEGIETSGSYKGTRHHNGTHTINDAAMGIDHQNYNLTPILSHILGTDGRGPRNAQNVANGIQIWNRKLSVFRVSKLKERYWENYSLSWTFWYLIYNNDVISMAQMQQHFQYVEQNPNMKGICTTYFNELTAMTQMISFFNSNPCFGFWYVYWHDIYKMNSDLPGIKSNRTQFDPTYPTSIAFRPMGRKATEAFLKKCKGEKPLGKKQAEHLDRLFVRIDEVAKKHPPTATAIKLGFATPIAVSYYVPSTTANKMARVSPGVYAEGSDIEMPSVYATPSAIVDDGSSVWVGFAKNPVAPTANPKHVTIVAPSIKPDGSAEWAFDKISENGGGQEEEEVFNRGNKNEIGLHTNRKCAKQHGLIRFNTPHSRFGCDLCRQGVPKDSVMYGCKKCNYDICASCESKKTDGQQDFSDSEEEEVTFTPEPVTFTPCESKKTDGQDFSDSEEEEHTLDLEPAIVIAGKLPEGWSLETTGDGKMYYIKQKDKKTAKWKAPNGSLNGSNLHVNGIPGSQIQWKFGTGILPSSSNTADYYPEGQPTPLTYKDAAASPVTGLDATLKKNGNQSFAEGLYYAVDKATSIKLIPFDPENRAATTPTGLVEDRYYEVENLVGQTNERYIAGTIFKANVSSRDMLAPCTVHPVAYGDFVWEGEKFVIVEGKKLTAPKCSKCSKPMILEDCDDSSKNCDKCHGSRGGWWCRECNTVICLDCKHHYLGMT